jgi:hypothetical protein
MCRSGWPSTWLALRWYWRFQLRCRYTWTAGAVPVTGHGCELLGGGGLTAARSQEAAAVLPVVPLAMCGGLACMGAPLHCGWLLLLKLLLVRMPDLKLQYLLHMPAGKARPCKVGRRSRQAEVEVKGGIGTTRPQMRSSRDRMWKEG